MSYEVIIDISDIERRSFDFKRMFDESIPCKERIVRCRDCTNYATDELGNYCTLMDFEDVVSMADKFCAWGERIDAQPQRLRGEGE